MKACVQLFFNSHMLHLHMRYVKSLIFPVLNKCIIVGMAYSPTMIAYPNDRKRGRMIVYMFPFNVDN